MRCIHCQQSFEYDDDDVHFDFKGTTDTKYVVCPKCGRINIVGYVEQPDRTGWYYQYDRRKWK